MLRGPVGPARPRNGAKAAAARSLSSSLSSDEVALETRFVSGGALRRVGRVSDDDFETSSYEETTESSFSDNSEEYVPLAFGYIKGNPRRHAGAPAHKQIPSGVSETGDSQTSMSDAAPLEMLFERTNARRGCGKGARRVEEDEVTTSISSFDEDDDSASSAALSVEFARTKRTRGVGKVKDVTYEVSDSESAISLSDEDEAPLNAQLIYTLVKRLRNPLDEVTPEAFDYLDFNDANFREVLEPLKQIKACLERRASYPMKQNGELEAQIKAAVQSLPSQKAIAVKVQTVKSRQLKPSQPTSQLYRGGESSPESAEILQAIVARLRDGKDEVPLRDFEKVDWTDRNFEPVLQSLQQIRAYMEAKEVALAKPADKSMHAGTALDDKIKTAVMALPSDKVMAAKVKTVASRPMSRGPSNGEAIRELINRLKDPSKQVPAEAFEELDWNDEAYSRELEPLVKIRAFMEAKECMQKRPGENVMRGTTALDHKIKTAVLSLPPEKEMVAKVQAVKSRQIRPAQAPGNVRHGGESAAEELQALRAQEEKAKTAVLSAPPQKAKDATVRTVRSRPMSRAPTNGEEILDLIKRLKDPEELVQLRAFDKVDFNDRNFARELEPLQQIRSYMEAREAAKKLPGDKHMPHVEELEDKIKVAILSLPPEKAVAVKIQMIKERDMAPAVEQAKPQVVKVGKMSAPAGTVKKMKDSVIIAGKSKKAKSKEGKLSASSSQVMQVGAKVIAAHQPKYKTRESTALSEPTKKVRRPARTAGRNISFSKLEEAPPGEIVDKDQVLQEAAGPQRLMEQAPPPESIVSSRNISRVPSRPAQKPDRRPRNRRPGSSVSFGGVPEDEVGIIHEEDENLVAAKRKPQRRRATHKQHRNLSISSLPDLEAGEVHEEPVLPDKPAAREAAILAATAAPPKAAAAQNAGAKKKRRVRANTNNRSCSFSEVALDEVHEVPDNNATALKGAETEPETAKSGAAAQPKKTKKLVRRRRPAEEGGVRALDYSSPEMDRGDEIDETAEERNTPAPPPKGRRPNVTRSRGTDASMIEDGENGEILEEAEAAKRGQQQPSATPEKASVAAGAVATKHANGRALTAASRGASLGRKSSDLSAAPRKRRQRPHAGKELSISAIPDDAPGEIVEDDRDTLAATAPSSSLTGSMRHSGQGKSFPHLGPARGSMRHSDRPLSSVRSSMEDRKGTLMPNAEPGVMPDAVNTARLPPAQGRRSAEPTVHSAKPPVSKLGANAARIPPVRASR